MPRDATFKEFEYAGGALSTHGSSRGVNLRVEEGLVDAVVLPELVLERTALDARVGDDNGVDDLLDVGRQAFGGFCSSPSCS